MKIPPPPTAEQIIAFIFANSQLKKCPDCGTEYHGEQCPCYLGFVADMQSNPEFDDSHNWDIKHN